MNSVVQAYVELLQSFLSTETSASELEAEFFRRFKGETEFFGPSIFAVLDRFFGDLDAYCDDPVLREDGDLDETQLRAAAVRALGELTAGDPLESRQPGQGGAMKGLLLCTLVLEFNYSKNLAESLGTVWLFGGDATDFLETSDESLDSVPGWHKIIGPIDYQAASEVQTALRIFLESEGVSVISEGICD